MGELLKCRHNVMDITSIKAFENIIGGMNGNCKDVYFVRLLGESQQFLSEIKDMDASLGMRMLEGKSVYIRLQELPKLALAEDVGYYSGCYDNFQSAGSKMAVIRSTAGDEQLQEILGNAVRETIRVFAQGDAQLSDSMKRNFAVKLLYWFDSVMERLNQSWSEKLSIKVVASNVTKKQEYMFYYMLTMAGMDVLLLQNEGDIAEGVEQLGLSKKYRLGDFGTCKIPEFDFRQCPKSDMAAAGEGDDVGNTVHSNTGTGTSAPVRIKLPERHPRRGSENPATRQGETGKNRIPIVATAGSAATGMTGSTANAGTTGTVNVCSGEQAEMSFESLAQLASSVVMIVIHNEKGEPVGSGSGIMIGRKGYILTNNHVACGGRAYSVRIEDDDTVYRTDEMIKYNPVLDLAIIRIDRELKPLPIYQGAKKLVRGQKVVAIGSPLGLFNSVSDGIISGFRKIDDVDMIQFTAPISNGSSGGAVLNMYGEVIGISTSGFDAGQNINLAMGYECINTFIRGFTG